MTRLGGHSYGLEYHFRWEMVADGDCEVFNYVDGAIYARVPGAINAHGFNWAPIEAARLCQRFNGQPGVDVGGIDSTS